MAGSFCPADGLILTLPGLLATICLSFVEQNIYKRSYFLYLFYFYFLKPPSLGWTGSSANSQEARSDDNEEDQWSLWGRLVADWSTTYKKRNAYVKDLVRKGIPHHFRGVVWPLLCGANDSPAKSQYAEYIKATSACEKVFFSFINFTSIN